MAETDAVLCKHSKTEVFEDEKGRGFFAECNICEAVGPLRKKSSEARKALRAMQSARPHGQGGVREGAGRKRVLSEDAKFFACTLEPKQLKKIDRFIASYNKKAGKDGKQKLNGRSAGVRKLLDQLKV